MGIKFGVIGCGNIIRRAMGRAFQEAPGADLTAVMDTNPAKAEETAARYGAQKTYGGLDDLLADEEIEAVYVAVPVHLHKEVTLEASAAGKHVLCEKPMAMDVAECLSMIQACRKAKVKLMIGFMMRFHPCHRKAREMIQNGELGRIVLVRAQQSYEYPTDPNAWQQKKELSGGGALMDAGSHCIDLLRFLTGEDVREVVSFTDNLAFEYNVEDTATVLMRFKSGTQGVVDACFSTPDDSVEQRLEIYGTKGSILGSGTISPFPKGELVIHVQGRSGPYEYEPADLYVQEIQHFVSCIEEDKEPICSGTDGLKAQEVMSAAYTSAKQNKVIAL